MDDLDNVDIISSNVNLLYVFEDNEAVNKMIKKGRSPTMRHVSRTHRVALDWWLDWINLDPKIQIKYIDTKKQLAGILTKGNFTRDEWNNLLHLFNISIFSSASCPEAMSKRMQQGTGEERIVAKSKPTLNLVSHTAASSSTVPTLSAPSRPGILRAPSQQGSNLIAQCAGKPAAGGSNQSDASSANVRGNSLLQTRTRIRVFENVQGNLPQKISTSTTSTTRSGRTSTAYLVLTFHTSRKSTRTCDNNSSASQKTKWRTSMWIRWYGECLWSLLNEPQFTLETIIWRFYIQPEISHKEPSKLVRKQTAIQGISRTDWQEHSWKRTTLLADRAVRLSTAKVYVCSDSVLCKGQNQWKSRKRMEGESRLVYEFIPMWRIGSNRRGAEGVRVEHFPRIHYIADSRRDAEHDDWNTMWTWAIPGTDHLHVNVQRHCISQQTVQEDLRTDTGRFLGPGSDKKCYGTHTYKPNGKWDESLRTWCSTSVKADTPYSVDPVLWNEEIWKAKEKDNCLSISVATTTSLNWFFEQLFPSISSVDTEQ